jgi:hypothetical protein
VVAVKVMDLDVAAEECRLEDHNEAEDARFFIGLGETHVDPIEIDIIVGSRIGTGTGSTSPLELFPDSDAGGSNSNSKKRSKCWNDFDELTKIVNGKKVRYVACCDFCKQTLTARSTSGTGHLLRHNCPAKKAHERSGQVQFVLKYNVDGTLQCWEYSASIARTELCHLIARDDLPL